MYGHELGELTINPFGFPLDAIGTTAASGPTYVNAVHARLLAAAVPDPKEADLFFIPESAANDTQRCDSLAARLDSYWKRRASALARCPTILGGKAAGTISQPPTFARRSSRALHGSRWPFSTYASSWASCNLLGFVRTLYCPSPRGGSPHGRLLANRGWQAARGCQTRRVPTPTQPPPISMSSKCPTVDPSTDLCNSGQKRERPLLAVAAFNSRGHRNFHGQMDLRRRLLAQCERANGGAAASVVRIPRPRSGTSLSTIDGEVRLATLMAASQERQASRSEGSSGRRFTGRT